jgi:hypothetical protein
MFSRRFEIRVRSSRLFVQNASLLVYESFQRTCCMSSEVSVFLEKVLRKHKIARHNNPEQPLFVLTLLSS